MKTEGREIKAPNWYDIFVRSQKKNKKGISLVWEYHIIQGIERRIGDACVNEGECKM